MRASYCSALKITRHASSGNRNRKEARRAKPDSKPLYDVIAGGGGHGLATTCYLASEYTVTNVEVIGMFRRTDSSCR